MAVLGILPPGRTGQSSQPEGERGREIVDDMSQYCQQYLEDSQDPEPCDMDHGHRGTRYEDPQLIYHLVPTRQATNQSTANRDYIMHQPSVLVLLIQTNCPQSSVAIVEHLKQTLVDHVLSYVHTK